jgi:hypothetical protein
LRIKAIQPCLDLGVIDHMPRIDVCQRLECHSVTSFFKGDEVRERLLDDPATGAFEAGGEHVYLIRKRDRDVGCDYTVFGGGIHRLLLNHGESSYITSLLRADAPSRVPFAGRCAAACGSALDRALALQ